MYQLLVYLHILGGVTWVGGAIYAQALGIKVSRSEDPTELPAMARHLEVLGLVVFLPASLVVIDHSVFPVLPEYTTARPWSV